MLIDFPIHGFSFEKMFKSAVCRNVLLKAIIYRKPKYLRVVHWFLSLDSSLANTDCDICTYLSIVYNNYWYACADLEGGSGPPLEFAKLNIADITGNEKISNFSYLCTSTIIRQTESIHKITIK